MYVTACDGFDQAFPCIGTASDKHFSEKARERGNCILISYWGTFHIEIEAALETVLFGYFAIGAVMWCSIWKVNCP